MELDPYKGYLDRKKIKKANDTVKRVFEKLGENHIMDAVESCFSNYSYFAVSALGENPNMDEEGAQVEKISPWRVTEPFYWLLSKLNYIPYYHCEIWENKKQERKKIELFYYDWERNGSAQKQIADCKEKNKIKEKGFFGSKWKLVEKNDSI